MMFHRVYPEKSDQIQREISRSYYSNISGFEAEQLVNYYVDKTLYDGTIPSKYTLSCLTQALQQLIPKNLQKDEFFFEEFVGILRKTVESTWYNNTSDCQAMVMSLLQFLMSYLEDNETSDLNDLIYDLFLRVSLRHPDILHAQELIKMTYMRANVITSFLKVSQLQFDNQQNLELDLMEMLLEGVADRLNPFRSELDPFGEVRLALENTLSSIHNYIKRKGKHYAALLFTDLLLEAILDFAVQTRLCDELDFWVESAMEYQHLNHTRCDTIFLRLLSPLIKKHSHMLSKMHLTCLYHSEQFTTYFMKSKLKFEDREQFCITYLNCTENVLLVLRLAMGSDAQVYEQFFQQIDLQSEIRFLLDDDRVEQALHQWFFHLNPEGTINQFQESIEACKQREDTLSLKKAR